MKNSAGITIIGLGPGGAELLTRQAWEILENLDELWVRTRKHPALEGLPLGLLVHSFDDLYEHQDTFEAVYAAIVDQVLELGRRPQGVAYAVPGHPHVAEATTPLILERAAQAGLPVQVIGGMSFLEPVFSALKVDPLPQTAIVDALELSNAHVPPFPPNFPALIAQVYSRQVASGVKLALMEAYPDEHPVTLVHEAGNPEAQVKQVPLHQIDLDPRTGLLTSLYVPPLVQGAAFEAFQEIISHLRAPDGCPWDREQTHQSLRQNLLEESYEVLTALDADDAAALCEELGDLLLQIVLHAQIASEYGEFRMTDVLEGIYTKIVRRHPHVFGDVNLNDAEAVLQNWEKLKAAERGEQGKPEKGLLEGVPAALPALEQALTYQERAARVGFDWPEIQGVWDKLLEELAEVQAAPEPEARTKEIGDLLFATVNLARWFKIDAESALREANLRFRQRFEHIERSAREANRSLHEMTLDEMEALWQEAKRGEK